jgi:hypothetical protein
MFDLEKKFFKQTLDTFRSSAQNNNEFLKKFDIVFNKIIESKQLNDVDLFELATNYKTLVIPDNIKLMRKNKSADIFVNDKKENERAGVIMPHFIKAAY